MRLLIDIGGVIIIFTVADNATIEQGGRMDINDELIEQWEPKINKMLQNTFVIGLDREDIAQELRIAIVKAAQGYNEDKGVLFHTYLHTAMVNTIRTLIYKAERQLKSASLDTTFGEDNSFSYADTLEDSKNTLMDDTEFDMLLSSAKLDDIEQDFLRLRIEGMTMEEITQDLGDSAYKIRHNLQEKVKYLFTYHQRFSLAFACLPLALLGAFLGRRLGQGGISKLISAVLLFLLLCFYPLVWLGEGLAIGGSLSPFMGAWLPVVFSLGVIGGLKVVGR